MRHSTVIAVVSSIILCAGVARAVVVPEGANVALPGTTLAARPELAGVIIATALRPFSVTNAAGTFSGFVTDEVSKNIDGAIEFDTWIHGTTSTLNPAGGPVFFGIKSINHSAFPDTLIPVTDCDYRIDSVGTTGPFNAARDASPGSNVTFFWPNFLQTGTDSHFFFIRTSSPWFDANGSYTIDGDFGTVTIPAFEPAVPEPAVLSILGLGALGLLRRRRA